MVSARSFYTLHEVNALLDAMRSNMPFKAFPCCSRCCRHSSLHTSTRGANVH